MIYPILILGSQSQRSVKLCTIEKFEYSIAYSHSLVGQEVIVTLEATFAPVFGTSSPKTFLINSNFKTMGGKDNNNPNNGQPYNSGNQPGNTANGGAVDDPLKDEGFDIGYHGSIEIGRQTFTVISDT
ncbi:9198_t:CDS:2, partial [Ambispora leptoticha]